MSRFWPVVFVFFVVFVPEEESQALSGALRDALEVVSAGLAALSEFSYRGIEPDKFNDKLDDLIGAINAGDARNVADNARFLAGQLSDLDRRQGLEDAKRRLREQVKKKKVFFPREVSC